MHFERSHGNCDEAQTPQDLCTSLLSAKTRGGTSFWQKQKINASNETSTFDDKSEMHDYRRMMVKNNWMFFIGKALDTIQRWSKPDHTKQTWSMQDQQ